MPDAPTRTIPLILFALACTGPAIPAIAQNNSQEPWQQVDLTVTNPADLRVFQMPTANQGVNNYGRPGSLFMRDQGGPQEAGAALSQGYQLRRPGITAYIDRPDYLLINRFGEAELGVMTLSDGTVIDMVPPNTVFDLVYRPPTGPIRPGWSSPYLASTFLDMQVHGAVTGDTSTPAPAKMPIAHKLPEHLIKAREARRAEAENNEASIETDLVADAPGDAIEDAPVDTPTDSATDTSPETDRAITP